MDPKKHQVTKIDNYGKEVVLKKPLNESAMTEDEKLEWHKQRNEHIAEKEH